MNHLDGDTFREIGRFDAESPDAARLTIDDDDIVIPADLLNHDD